MTSEYEEFINSQKNSTKEETLNKHAALDLTKKIDLIIKKLDAIEEHLNIKPKTIYDDMKEAYTVKDTSLVLGCSEKKVREYIKWNMLEHFKVGYKKMVTSRSIKKLIQQNLKSD
tara:strand:+ start:129 stop:473 length:345 start_codon:yes stop_codon:yes gene_type:complete